ncbi:MAG: hypothetical protein ACI9LY_002267 [Arenicella sp.]
MPTLLINGVALFSATNVWMIVEGVDIKDIDNGFYLIITHVGDIKLLEYDYDMFLGY